MAERGKPNELITFQELAVSNADEIAALVALLERTGILTHAEVPLEGLEMCLRRVAQAVEAGEVPAELLADLQSELAAAWERPPEEDHTAATQHSAALAAVPEEEAAQTLASVQAQPGVTAELLMHRIAEAWLEGERERVEMIRRGRSGLDRWGGCASETK